MQATIVVRQLQMISIVPRWLGPALHPTICSVEFWGGGKGEVAVVEWATTKKAVKTKADNILESATKSALVIQGV